MSSVCVNIRQPLLWLVSRVAATGAAPVYSCSLSLPSRPARCRLMPLLVCQSHFSHPIYLDTYNIQGDTVCFCLNLGSTFSVQFHLQPQHPRRTQFAATTSKKNTIIHHSRRTIAFVHNFSSLESVYLMPYKSRMSIRHHPFQISFTSQ